jgi:hypothetical protein
MTPDGSSQSGAGSQGWLQRLFQPMLPPPIPYVRAWKIALRTAHLMAAGMLLGGHAFHAPDAALRPWLYLAIASGIGMIALETGPSLHFIFEGWGALMVTKLALLITVPFAGSFQVPILLAVVALAAVGSHMSARFRHYSLLYRKVIRD